mgnify:CR=1 FL=1
MIEKNFKKKTSWKNWLIKKLITSEASKEEILNFIIKDDENKQIYEFQDNNEKNLMKNILNLNNKSVENIMVSRAEIVAVEKNQSIDKILLIKDKDNISLGQPYVKNAKIELEVVSHKRDKKIIVYKMRPKKKTRRKMGHRQELTRVMVKSITIGNSDPKSSSKKETVKKETKPKSAKSTN